MIAYWFYICVFITQNSWLQQMGCDTLQRGWSSFLKPPSPFSFLCGPPLSSPHACFRSWGQWLNPATNRPPSRLHYPSKPSTAASNVHGPPGWFSRLLPHPRPLPLAPAWPLVDLSTCPSAGSSLPHECRQGRACWGWDANRRQRICNSFQQHILPLPVYWDWNCHQYDWGWREGQMCIHTLMSCLCTHLCACVCRVCMCVQLERWCCIWWLLEWKTMTRHKQIL